MLYVKDALGQYQAAPDQVIMAEALQVSNAHLKPGVSINSPELAKQAVAAQLCHRKQEVFGCLFLDNQHKVLDWSIMFYGTINSNTVHPREIVKGALQHNAAAVILAHNHPSGHSQPSLQDIELTKKLQEILKVVDVRVLDHLIVGDQITSFSELGIFAN